MTAAKPAAAAAKPRNRAPAAKAAPRPAVPSQRLAGRLELAAGARHPVAAGEVAQGVVYFLPKAGGARPQPARFTVDTQSKGFSPSLLVVPVGSTVSFPNRDQILHNVFSKTPGAAFDLGYYGPGASRETRFSKPGLVVVNCSVHNAMRSNVLVLATPYYTRPGRDGRFTLNGLPPGPGTLVFWHPRANAQSLAVTGPVSEPVLRRLVASRAPLDAHRH
jgi:plastocyanin